MISDEARQTLATLARAGAGGLITIAFAVVFSSWKIALALAGASLASLAAGVLLELTRPNPAPRGGAPMIDQDHTLESPPPAARPIADIPTTAGANARSTR